MAAPECIRLYDLGVEEGRLVVLDPREGRCYFVTSGELEIQAKEGSGRAQVRTPSR